MLALCDRTPDVLRHDEPNGNDSTQSTTRPRVGLDVDAMQQRIDSLLRMNRFASAHRRERAAKPRACTTSLELARAAKHLVSLAALFSRVCDGACAEI
jgi:hypothetical protein